MSALGIGLIAVSCAGAWLVLLMATGFNLAAVSLGLLPLLFLSGRES